MHFALTTAKDTYCLSIPVVLGGSRMRANITVEYLPTYCNIKTKTKEYGIPSEKEAIQRIDILQTCMTVRNGKRYRDDSIVFYIGIL